MNPKWTFLLACWVLAASIRGFESLAAPNPPVKSGQARTSISGS